MFKKNNLKINGKKERINERFFCFANSLESFLQWDKKNIQIKLKRKKRRLERQKILI